MAVDYKEIRVRRDIIATFIANRYVPDNGEPIGLIGSDGKATAYLIGDGSSTVDQLPSLSKGDRGPTGDPGLPGVNAVENDSAVAQYIAAPGGSATKTAVSSAILASPTTRLTSWVESRVSTSDALPRVEDQPVITWNTNDATVLSSPAIYKPAICGTGAAVSNWDGASDPVFRYEPGAFETKNGPSQDYGLYGMVKPGGDSQAARWPTALSFVTQSTNSVVELAYYSLVTSAFIRVEVNGRMVSDAEMVQPPANGGKITITFPTAASRTIRVWATGELGIALIRVPNGQTLSKPAAPKRLIALVGDSYLNGAGSVLMPYLGTTHLTTYGLRLARYLAADSVMLAGIGGTGLVAGATATPARDYASRADFVNGKAPQVVVINASINDGTAAGSLQSATTALLAKFSSVPEVYVIGGIVAGYEGNYAAVKAATIAAGRVFLDIGGLMFGAGRLGDPRGDGTNDYWRIEDGAHPTIDAHVALARSAYRQYARARLNA